MAFISFNFRLVLSNGMLVVLHGDSPALWNLLMRYGLIQDSILEGDVNIFLVLLGNSSALREMRFGGFWFWVCWWFFVVVKKWWWLLF